MGIDVQGTRIPRLKTQTLQPGGSVFTNRLSRDYRSIPFPAVRKTSGWVRGAFVRLHALITREAADKGDYFSYYVVLG